MKHIYRLLTGVAVVAAIMCCIIGGITVGTALFQHPVSFLWMAGAGICYLVGYGVLKRWY